MWASFLCFLFEALRLILPLITLPKGVGAFLVLSFNTLRLASASLFERASVVQPQSNGRSLYACSKMNSFSFLSKLMMYARSGSAVTLIETGPYVVVTVR